jgi:acetyl esterase/lipase
MKHLLAVALGLLFASPLVAQMPTPVAATAPAQPDAILLYPDLKADPAVKEVWARFGTDLTVRNVSQPTLTPVLPKSGTATGAAVVVAPGGAFMLLSMTHEGWDVAHWLADHGIAAFVLKYRLIQTPADQNEANAFMGKRMAEALKDRTAPPTIVEPRATTDALAALDLVRAGAARWHIDPKRVGMIGFSAGAMTTLNATLEGKPDERPAFMGYIYGPMLAVPVPDNATPMFAAIAMDDPLFPSGGFGIVEAWHKAHRPVELHVYERGGHGFGMGRAGTTTTGVMEQFRLWLDARGLLKTAK